MCLRSSRSCLQFGLGAAGETEWAESQSVEGCVIIYVLICICVRKFPVLKEHMRQKF